MPKKNKANDSQEYVVLRVPKAAWDLLSETLQVDSISTAFEPALRSSLTIALSQVQVIASLMDPILGHVIKDFRKLTKQEADGYGWYFLPGQACPVIVLENGTIIFPSKDAEGNGPGALFGKLSDGKPIYFLPEGN